MAGDTVKKLMLDSMPADNSEQINQFVDMLSNSSGNVEYYLNDKNQVVKTKLEMTIDIKDKTTNEEGNLKLTIEVNSTMKQPL